MSIVHFTRVQSPLDTVRYQNNTNFTNFYIDNGVIFKIPKENEGNFFAYKNTKIILDYVSDIYFSPGNITVIYRSQTAKIYCLIQIYLNQLIVFAEKIGRGIRCIYNTIKNLYNYFFH